MGDALSIALISIKQLVNTRSGHRLSPSGFTVCLPEELIILTLSLKKWLTNAQLCSKLPFTLWRLVNEDQVCLQAIQFTYYGDPQSIISKDLYYSNCNLVIFMDYEYDIYTIANIDIAKTHQKPILSNIQKWFTQQAEAKY